MNGKVKILIWLGFMSVLFGFLPSCLSFKMSEKEVKEEFNQQSTTLVQRQLEHLGTTINYAVRLPEPESLPLVMFIHGSPGSWSAFKDFLKDSALIGKAKLISIDRPGFGDSGYGKGMKSLQTQCAIIAEVLKKEASERPVYLVGHSLGGPIVARMAMDYPELIIGIIMVAPSIAPELEPNEWFRPLLARSVVRWIIPGSLRASNEEIWELKAELELMHPLWENIRIPVTVIQGEKDDLVAPGNAAFAQKMLINSPPKVVLKPELNHFIPWTAPELIKGAILDQLASPRPSPKERE